MSLVASYDRARRSQASLAAVLMLGAAFASSTDARCARMSLVEDEARDVSWRSVQDGVEYAVIDLGVRSPQGDNRMHVVRVCPERAALEVVLAKERDGKPRSAGEWCKQAGLAAAINLGMFQQDGLTNVGYLRHGAVVHHARWTEYKSALALAPTQEGLLPGVIVDLDEPGVKDVLARYGTVIQNLRLIKGSGRNVWAKQAKAWSEAAVATDDRERVLFVFCRSPFSMWEFNRLLLSLPLGITRAMHVEGGPEASLSIHAGGVDLDLCGSFETGFMADDSNQSQWPIPNVLGVASVSER